MLKHSRSTTSDLDAVPDYNLPRGSTILVEGNPGSGKTMLSAQFLYDGASRYSERGMYVSFFENREDFKRNCKSVGLNFEPLETKKRVQIVHCIVMTEAGMKESIGDIVKSILAFKPQRLVFDSISSILQVMGHDETRAFLQTIFGKIVRQRIITTLLIGEIPYGDGHTSDVASEFFADGIIRLGRSRDGFRTLSILKMRGARLGDPNRFFTLEQGFHLIHRPTSAPTQTKLVPWLPIKDGETVFSSGCEDLDSLLGGGYPKGQYVVLETDPNVPIDVIRLFQFPLAWNFLAQERSLLMLPTLGAESSEIMKLITQHIPPESFEGRVRIFERARRTRWMQMDSEPSYVVSTKADDPLEKTEELLNQTCLSLMRETGKPVARLIGFPTLQNIYSGRNDILFRAIGDAVAQNKYLGNFTLAVTRSDLEITPRILDIVDWHLQLIERNGCFFVRVVKPRSTPYYAVDSKLEDGCPMLKLTPMV